MDYKKANSVSNAMLISAMAMFGGTLLTQNGIVQLVCLVIGILLIIAAIIMRILYWRCPHCKKMLSLGFHREPEKCPRCRGNLIQQEKH